MNNAKAFEALTLQDIFNGVLGVQFDIFLPFQPRSKCSQLPHGCNSQSGSALGNHWPLTLAFSPICESVFHI
jgi:hypothetical protein